MGQEPKTSRRFDGPMSKASRFSIIFRSDANLTVKFSKILQDGDSGWLDRQTGRGLLRPFARC